MTVSRSSKRPSDQKKESGYPLKLTLIPTDSIRDLTIQEYSYEINPGDSIVLTIPGLDVAITMSLLSGDRVEWEISGGYTSSKESSREK